MSITDISCDGDAQKEQETSDADAPIAFWGNIWDQPTHHNQKAAFQDDVREVFQDIPRQKEILRSKFRRLKHS